MIQLFKGDGRVIKTIQNNKKPNLNGEYRLSSFVYVHPYEDGCLIKSTLTGQIFRLTDAEYRDLQGFDLSSPEVLELVRYRFVVEKQFDELAQYLLVLNVMRAMYKTAPGIGTFTILPTTACNARCVYCYEEGWQSKTMSKETADRVIDFICRTKQDGKIRLGWFGGEPLCGASLISYLCRALKDREVEFDSSIITNGTLFTPELAREAVELWGLKQAQISMDGAREDYEARKCYLQPELYNYDKAMEAAAYLSDLGVSVTLRCNYDQENLPGVQAFFDDCKTRFQGRNNISVYMEQLFQSADTGESASLCIEADKLLRYAQENHLYPRNLPSGKLKLYYCMADSNRKSLIIDPVGGLHRCESRIDDEPIGTIFDETLPPVPAPGDQVAEICKTCPFLPDCTPFRKNGCSLKSAGCRTKMELKTIREFEALLSGAKDDETAEKGSDCP